MKTRQNKGFTLVEILIVVVILGILAAIVIPQFSEASGEARLNSLRGNLQTFRSQLQLYKVQHNDQFPTLANFVSAMTMCSNQAGDDFVAAPGDATHPYGPYLQQIPVNPFTQEADVAADTTGDWHYDAASGAIVAGFNGATPLTAGGQNINLY